MVTFSIPLGLKVVNEQRTSFSLEELKKNLSFSKVAIQSSCHKIYNHWEEVCSKYKVIQKKIEIKLLVI